LWTPEQLKLLGCEFVAAELPPAERQKESKPNPAELAHDDPNVSKVRDERHRLAVRAAEMLRRRCALETRNPVLVDFLSACKFQKLP
jgi:hypothetical protein